MGNRQLRLCLPLLRGYSGGSPKVTPHSHEDIPHKPFTHSSSFNGVGGSAWGKSWPLFQFLSSQLRQ